MPKRVKLILLSVLIVFFFPHPSYSIQVVTEKDIVETYIPRALQRFSDSIKSEHINTIPFEWEVCDETVFCEYEDNVISKKTSEPTTGIVVKLDTIMDYSGHSKYVRWKSKYVNGKREGLYREYSKGKILAEKHYKNGVLDGISKSYLPGSTRETNYSDGVIVSEKEYGSLGLLSGDFLKERKYKNGEPTYMSNKRNGKLYEEWFYKQGQLSKTKTYYDTGELSRESFWKNNKIVKSINYRIDGSSWVSY